MVEIALMALQKSYKESLFIYFRLHAVCVCACARVHVHIYIQFK